MAFNPEVAVKALEKRVAGMESAADKLEAQVRAGGDIKSFGDRLTKPESIVKVLAESRVDSKVDAMEKTLKALDGAKFVDKATMEKLLDEKQKKMAEEQIKEAKAIGDKAVAESLKQVEKMKVEARLNVIEARLASLGR